MKRLLCLRSSCENRHATDGGSVCTPALWQRVNRQQTYGTRRTGHRLLLGKPQGEPSFPMTQHPTSSSSPKAKHFSEETSVLCVHCTAGHSSRGICTRWAAAGCEKRQKHAISCRTVTRGDHIVPSRLRGDSAKVTSLRAGPDNPTVWDKGNARELRTGVQDRKELPRRVRLGEGLECQMHETHH